MSMYNNPYSEILYKYNDSKDYDYAYKLGVAAAKKWSSKVTDEQLINAIKKGRNAGYFKRTDYMVWELFADYFRNSDEREYAVDKFTEHIKATAFRYFGKKQLKALFGNNSDERLLKEVVNVVMSGDGDDDIYPYENIDWGFQEVITARLKRIGNKIREQKRKQKVSAYKKQYAKKTVKRTVKRRK